MWIGLIFAGGASRRMGTDKAMIAIAGRTLLERAVDVVREAGGEPIVVGPPRPGAALAGARQTDETEGGRLPAGPLPALRHGLGLCPARMAAVALGCDVPLVPAAFLRHLVARAPGWEAVVPRVGGRMQVLTAAYDPACLPAIDRALQRGERAVHRILGDLRACFLEAPEIAPFGGDAIFLNVNTPHDRDEAERVLRERAS